MTALLAVALYGVSAFGFYVWATRTALPHEDDVKTGPSPSLKVVDGGASESESDERKAA
ncbi:MAG: hypothetical protein ACOCX1_03195 [Fimbriimonadaceae bacterium]